jgi:HAD superfamily hydrolase (TIGR01509 family)
MSSCELVIFDCDGVLVDSERITNIVFCSMLNELGLNVSLDDMFERFVGLSMAQYLTLITQMLGKPPPGGFVDELRLRSAKVLREKITAIPGVEQVLGSLSVPYCVASSGDHEKIQLTLGTTGLLKYFKGRIFSVTDVEHPKPAPDIFLFAAQSLGVKPQSCAVVEDTPTGVAAGIAAGMRVFGFSLNVSAHRLQEAGADFIFSDMLQFPQLLKNVQHVSPTDIKSVGT